MDIIGIICEYNPFHNGHLYHIKKIKEKYPNSLLIAVINGYFLERGEISILSKENKTKIALENGIDIANANIEKAKTKLQQMLYICLML